MSRRIFGTWGTQLDDDEFAQAFAALGVWTEGQGTNPAEVDADITTALSQSKSPVPFLPKLPLESMLRGEASISVVRQLPPAEVFRSAWSQATSLHLTPRLEVSIPRGGLPGLDVFWITEQLARPAVGASSIYVRADVSAASVGWSWPLTMGVLQNSSAQQLKTEILKSPHKNLFRCVDLGMDAAECDVLLLSSDLRAALQFVLEASYIIHADCVLVMGGLDVDTHRAHRLIQALLAEVKTSGVGVLRLPNEERAHWFDNFIAELSHNNPLDVALTAASRNLILPTMPAHPPFLTASRHLVEVAELSVFVQRLSAHLEESKKKIEVQLPPQAAQNLKLPNKLKTSLLGEMLRSNLPLFQWEHEGGEASDVTNLTREVEAQMGSKIKLPRIAHAKPPLHEASGMEADVEVIRRGEGHASQGWGLIQAGPWGGGGGTAAARAPANAEPVHEVRRAQARFVQRKTNEKDIIAKNALLPMTDYVVQVRIAAPDHEWGAELDQNFPSETLPPSTEGHGLKVALVELAVEPGGQIITPQMAPLFLPPTVDSAPIEFFIHTQDGPATFRARLIFLFENRVLQTALLEAGVDALGSAFPSDTIGLRRETVVRPSFEGIRGLQSFDAALVLNHTADGLPGVTAIANNSVTFLEPVGLRDSFNNIAGSIATLTALPEVAYQLDDGALVVLLRQLANYGNITWKLFAPRMEVLARARRIQVVEAREGALLPVEFFYEGKSPLNSAALCGHAQGALAAADVGAICPNLASANFTCPTDFWGFNRVIERRPHMDIAYGKEYELSEPSPHMDTLDILSNAVFSASSKVRNQDADDVVDEIRKATGKDVPRPATWTDLEAAVREHSPSLLVLMPHSLMDPDTPTLAALELGGEVLNISQLDKVHVCGPARDRSSAVAKPGPAVLLLGCSTELPKYPFQNFVSGFQSCGASLVLGTLSTIRGRHSVNFMTTFMKALSESVAKDQTFGAVLLRTKRHLLSQGDPFALTLTAYGNAGWVI